MLCPCKSGKNYTECCSLYHHGISAANALQLMRSRYSAYALGQVDYIIETTHPKNRQYKSDFKSWRHELLAFCTQTHFQNLEILDFIDGQNKAYVSFFARLQQHGRDASFKEKSYFEKVNGKWMYRSGKTLNK